MQNHILDTQAIGIKTLSTQRIMLWVLIALIPGTLTYALLISSMVLVNILFAAGFALLLEALALRLRGVSVITGIQDGSIVLAATLLAIAVPPMLPIWQLFVGVFIMVLLGKQVYGGLGNNPFNPAMVGYAALMVSFPQTMTLWFAPELLQQLDSATLLKAKLSLTAFVSDTGSDTITNAVVTWDGLTRATPLEQARTMRIQSTPLSSATWHQLAISSGWLWVNSGFLLGGLFILYRRIISWHIPTSLIISFTLCTLIFSSANASLLSSLFAGAVIFGAFFIATDPVSAASSRRGQLVFGAGIGILTFVIREYGGYPEGIAFAVLLMNLCVPLIDHIDSQWDKHS